MASYARELSIVYANAEDNDTILGLKKAGEGFLKENKELKEKVKKLEKKLKNYSNGRTETEFYKLESKKK